MVNRMSLLEQLLALDPEEQADSSAIVSDYNLMTKALENAQQLLPDLDVSAIEPLLDDLRNKVNGSPYIGYLALLIQGQLSPLSAGRAYHGMGLTVFYATNDVFATIAYYTLARLCYAACPIPSLRDQARLKAAYASAIYAYNSTNKLQAALSVEDNVKEALTMAHEALSFFEQSGMEYEQGRAWSIISDIYQYAEHPQAINAARRALFFAELIPDLHYLRGRLLRDLAQAYYFLQDDIVRSHELLAQAENYLIDADENQRGSLFSTQALIALDVGEFDLAQRLLTTVEILYKNAPNQPGLALNAFDQARLQLSIGDLSNAERLLWQARKGFEEEGLPKEAAEALLLLAQLRPFNEALALYQTAEQIFAERNNLHALTLAQFERARFILRQAPSRRNAEVRASALTMLASLVDRFTDLGRPRYALLARVELALSQHANAPALLAELVEPVTALGDPLTLARLRQALGQAYESNGKLLPARTAYEQAMGAVESARTQIRLNAQLARFFAQRRRPYERSFALALAAGDLPAAWYAAEKPRAPALLDLLQNSREQAFSLAPDHPLWTEVQSVRSQLNLAYAARMPETRSNAFRSRSDHALRQDDSVAQLEARLGALLDQLQLAGDRRAAWELGQVCDPASLAEALGPRTALVEYMLVSRVDMPSTRDLYALILAPEGLHVPAQDGLIASEEVVSMLIARVQHTDFDNDQVDLQPLLEQFYTHLIAPLAAAIAPYEHIVFVLPDDETELARVPLHAAFDGQQYLVERHTISYAPSASILWQSLQRPALPIRQVLAAGYGLNLHHAAQELEQVRRAFPTTQKLPGPFQRDHLLQQIASADLVHLSCHAEPGNQRDARFAYLAIGPDQFIFAHDCFAHQLRADLVVLSACETGKEDQVGLGLVGGFLAAGARTIVATLWKAHDTACVTLMEQFYRALTENATGRATALALAQRQLIHSPDQSHPARWAPFILVGAIDPLNFSM
jgi:CHAT domain-containing protein